MPADTLSGFITEHNIKHCDLIKFNCEGAEFPILLSTMAPDAEPLFPEGFVRDASPHPKTISHQVKLAPPSRPMASILPSPIRTSENRPELDPPKGS